MAIIKITENDFSGKGVVGQAEIPGLPAAEMQYKVEEIVRDVAVPKINEIIDEFENVDEKMDYLERSTKNTVNKVSEDFEALNDEVDVQIADVKQQVSGLSAEIENIPNTYATKEEVEEIIENNGQAVTSVFGRLGAVTGQKGDYTAEMVGAAPVSHTHTRRDITDFPSSLPASDVYSWAKQSSKPVYTYSDVGAEQSGAVSNHNASSSAHNSLFSAKQNKPTKVSASGAVSVALQDNCEYTYTGVTSLNMTGTDGEAYGFITFGSSVGSISVPSERDGDNIAAAGANEVWEFSCYKNRFIWKKWG